MLSLVIFIFEHMYNFKNLECYILVLNPKKIWAPSVRGLSIDIVMTYIVRYIIRQHLDIKKLIKYHITLYIALFIRIVLIFNITNCHINHHNINIRIGIYYIYNRLIVEQCHNIRYKKRHLIHLYKHTLFKSSLQTALGIRFHSFNSIFVNILFFMLLKNK